MAVLKCKMCGGELILAEGSSTAECAYCGSIQTVPFADDDRKMILYERANKLRYNNEFDKAYSIYESIVADYRNEAEAYWGLLLCKYGIEYVDDPGTGKKIPTCHRVGYESIMDDADFEMVMENADVLACRIYREEAKQIEEIRRGIIEISNKEEPYDIFICYKETDVRGERTLDSVMMQDLYEVLTDKGYRTFFARITLEDKLGQEYEPYIFAALNSAKIMLVMGTSYEYFNAVWVKNEWSRYLKLMSQDKTKYLIPCYKNVDAYDIPKEFVKLQAQDLGKVGAMQDLLRGIEKILPMEKIPAAGMVQNTAAPGIESLLKRVDIFLADREWDKADEYCEKVLDIDPECALAYLGKLLAALKIQRKEDLKDYEKSFEQNENYKKIIRYADAALIAELEEYLRKILEGAGTDGCDVTANTLYKYTGKSDTVIIPNRVRYIAYGAFSKCDHVRKVIIPEGVISISENAFEGCKGLEAVIIPESITEIGNDEEHVSDAFSGCISLKDIRIADSNPRYQAVDNCIIDKKYRKLIFANAYSKIPEDKSVAVIGNAAFHKQGNLKSIEIPSCITEIEGGAVSECENLTEIRIAYDNPRYYAEKCCIIDKKKNAIIYGNTESEIPAGVNEIGSGAFQGCMRLKSVIIPNGVRIINDVAFDACMNLNEITIPDSVETIGYAAFSFTDIEKIWLPEKLSSIPDSLFNNCQKLAEITIPQGVVSIGEEAFGACENLKSLVIPPSVTYMHDDVFSYGMKVKLLTSKGSYAEKWAVDHGYVTEEAEEYKRLRQEKERVEHQEWEKQQKMEGLKKERDELQQEMSSLKGLFSGGRRKKIEARLSEIEMELNKL